MHGLAVDRTNTLVLVDLREAHCGLACVELDGEILNVVSDAFFTGDALRTLLDPSRAAQPLGGLEIAGVHAQILRDGLSTPGLAPLINRLTQRRFTAAGLGWWGQLMRGRGGWGRGGQALWGFSGPVDRPLNGRTFAQGGHDHRTGWLNGGCPAAALGVVFGHQL